MSLTAYQNIDKASHARALNPIKHSSLEFFMKEIIEMRLSLFFFFLILLNPCSDSRGTCLLWNVFEAVQKNLQHVFYQV